MVSKTRISKTQYLRYLEQDMKFCGLSEATKKQYRFITGRYLEFTENAPDFSRNEIMQFIASLGKVTNTYAAWVLSVVRRFHKAVRDYLPDEQRKWPLGPREGPKVAVRPQPSFGEKEISKLFRVIKNIRDYAIARLLFATGMRRDEVCRLTINDYSSPNIFIVMAKGEETRTVKLDRGTCLAIDEYLETREDRYPQLFLNDHSRPFTPSALSQVFKKYFDRIGAGERAGLHGFRRGLTTTLHDRGLSKIEIQKFIGWKTSTMVDRYVQLSPSEIGKRVEKVHPFYEEE